MKVDANANDDIGHRLGFHGRDGLGQDTSNFFALEIDIVDPFDLNGELGQLLDGFDNGSCH